MENFRYVDDVRAWLEPMEYEEFWQEIRPHCLVLEYRSVCDEQIETGQVTPHVMLDALKIMACHELTRRHRLKIKPATPWLNIVKVDE